MTRCKIFNMRGKMQAEKNDERFCHRFQMLTPEVFICVNLQLTCHNFFSVLSASLGDTNSATLTV